MRIDRQFVVSSGLAAVGFVSLSLVTLGDWVTTTTLEVVSDVSLIPLALTAALSCAWTAHLTSHRRRRAWWLLAAATGLWFLGEVGWYVNGYVVAEPSDPSIADVFYIVAALPAVAALLVFPPPERGRLERIRTLIGSLVVSGSVLFTSRAVHRSVIEPEPDPSTPATIVYFTYPLIDVALTSLALIVLMRAGSAARLHLTLIAAGFVAYTAADTSYAYLAAMGTYTPGVPWDLGWAAGYLLLALAARAPSARRPDRVPTGAGERASAWTSLTVYAPMFVAVVVAAFSTEPTTDPVMIVAGLVVLILFGIRQAMQASDNRTLHRELQRRVDLLQQRSGDLRRLAMQNERIMNSVVEGVVGVDAGGVVTYANAHAARLLHRRPDDLVGTHESDLFHLGADGGAAPSQHECPVAQALRSGSAVQQVNEQVARADGSRFAAELAVGPILDTDEVVGAVVVLRDISERRGMEQMKNEFISVVSHELRTPLTAIRGAMGLLAGGAAGPLPARAERMVAIALRSSERLTRLINDILDIERIESGAAQMELVEADAAVLVRATVDGLQPIASEQGLHLAIEEVSGRVLVDPDRIVQTLTNLVGNAMKFSPAGGTVTLRARCLPDSDLDAPASDPRPGAGRTDGVVQFSVHDQGRGIPAEKIDLIFERFEQVDSSDAREKGGTGLGLTISRSIVERHGGRIWVKSTLGAGATFHFTLPGVATASTIAPEDATPEPPLTTRTPTATPDAVPTLPGHRQNPAGRAAPAGNARGDVVGVLLGGAEPDPARAMAPGSQPPHRSSR